MTHADGTVLFTVVTENHTPSFHFVFWIKTFVKL